MNLVRDLKLRGVYARLPALQCRQLCQAACGPIVMSGAEWDRVVEAVGVEPRPTDEQAERLRCPMLDERSGRCTIYNARPLICRLFGMVEAMRCPHGCTPARWLSDAEAFQLMTEIEAITR